MSKKWVAQLTGAILAPSLIQAGRVVTVSNDGTVYAHNAETGQLVWTYNLPNVQFSLRGMAAPVALDSRTVLIASANAYVYAPWILLQAYHVCSAALPLVKAVQTFNA